MNVSYHYSSRETVHTVVCRAMKLAAYAVAGVRSVSVRSALVLVGLGAVGLFSPAGPGGVANAQSDNDLCRAGAVPDYDNVQSLEKVFGAVERGVGGQIIRAELRQRGFQNLCVWVYEVKTLDNSGKVTMAIYDASDMKLIGFNSASSPDIGPVVQVPQVDSTRKSLEEPDGDGRADSGGIEAATGDGGFSESDASTADATDNGQRGGSAGPKGEASTDSAADSDSSGADSAAAGAGSSDNGADSADGSGGAAAAASQ